MTQQRHNTAQKPLGAGCQPEHLYRAIQRLHRRLLAMERLQEHTPEVHERGGQRRGNTRQR